MAPCLIRVPIRRVEREHERVTVTRNGRTEAVIISPEDLAELEETPAVLSDSAALADIREADAAYAAGDVLRRCRRGPRAAPVKGGAAYELVLTPPAVRAVRSGLPVAAAVLQFSRALGREPATGGETAARGPRGDPFRATRHVPRPVPLQLRAR